MNPIVLNNRYRLAQRIGVGGMAYVYEAEDIVLKRRVAVKVLKEQFSEDEEFVSKFENEALAAASLNHPNIVAIYDVGRQRMDERVLHYIVMELIEGTTLKDAIRAHGKMTSPAIAKTGRQIAEALQRAHDAGIVHRDVKPANILITRDGDIKVADFGIARITSSSTVTFTNNILGTVHYISPEQAKGQMVDAQSDLYSLGVVLYEMATGKVPFDAETSVAVAMKHIQEPPVPPIESNPALHPGLNAIILKCMEKLPVDRYGSAMELAEALENYREMDDTAFIPVESRGDATEEVSLPREVVYESRPSVIKDEGDKRPKRWREMHILAAIALVVFVAGSIFLLSRNARRAEAFVAVPAVINLTEEAALERLEAAGLSGMVTERRPDDSLPEGVVIDQSIISGTQTAKGTVVNLSVSAGRAQAAVPSVANLSVDEATTVLEGAGFGIGSTQFVFDDEVDKDKVVGTSPAANTQVELGSRIDLVVSRGKDVVMTVVPVLVNQKQNAAIALINEAGLKLGSLEGQASAYPSGTVIYQSVEAGTSVEELTSIDIIVSTGQAAEQSAPPAQNTGRVLYNTRIFPPEGKETFEVTIYDLNESQSQPIFQKTFSSSSANAEGYILTQVEAREGARFSILIDGLPANTSSGNGGNATNTSQQSATE